MAEEHNLDNLTIYSDSNYVVQGVTEWIYKWRENGWKTAGGEDVKNRDIWKQLAGLVNDSRVKLTWKHVAAHAGIPGNEEADKLAVKGAQQVTIKVTKSEELPRMSSMEINSATEEKSTVTITRPCVIVEQKESTPTTINSTIQHENKINITPKRKAAKDRTETPVPGSLNGSFVSTKKTSAGPQRENVGEKSAASIEKEETVTIMTNMETILHNIVTEIHQLKEEQHEFRKEVKQQIGSIQEKQNVFEKSVLSFSSEVSENVRLCISKIEKVGDNSKREQADNHCHNELKVSIQNLQRKVESRLDVTKSSFHSLEASVSSAKTCVDQLSQDCTTEFNKLESKNNQINDKLLEMNKDFKATERKLTEVEKSLTTLSEKEEFMKPTRTAKERSSAVDNSASTNNKYAELQDDSDDEVIFKGSEPGKSNYESTRAAEKSLEKDTLEKSANTSKNINVSENVLNADESEKPKTYTRGNMVYLVGDSIAGQVNQVMLGKATKTFVKKLRAPKIDDLQPLTDQVKDAKLIIIHTGINNLRGKESATDKVNDIIKCVTSFKEVVPECEMVISKAIPIGDHKVDIERNLFNAEAEKKLTEIHKSKISFLDHGNLAERGVPIEDYYRKDLVHLVGKGVAIFTGNLEKEILRVLNKEEEQDKTQLYESAHSSQQDSGRNANDRDVHRGDRTFGHYIHTPTSDRQYNNRQKYTNERGQRYDRDNAVRGHFYGRGQRNDRDNGNRYTTYSRNHESSGYSSRGSNRDYERHYYRQYNRDDNRRRYRSNSRDNDRQYSRNNYDDERYGEREHRYVGYKDFDDGYDYYNRNRTDHF